MRFIATLLLAVIPTLLSAQTTTPPATCNLTPANVDQFCVALMTTFGFNQVAATTITNSLQGLSVASSLQASQLGLVSNQETNDIKTLTAQVDTAVAMAAAANTASTSATAAATAATTAATTATAAANAATIAANAATKTNATVGTRPSSTGYTIRIPAVTLIGASVPPNFQQSPGCPLNSKLQFAGAGSYYDFLVSIPQAGNYTFAQSVAFNVITGTYTSHIEAPIGTIISTFNFTPTTTNWNTATGSTSVSLQPGLQVIRLVVDKPIPATTNEMCWIQATQQ